MTAHPPQPDHDSSANGLGSAFLLCIALAVCGSGCSVKRFAINKLGDSLANSGTTYAADDDVELVGQALPFSLKLVEGLLKVRATGTQ